MESRSFEATQEFIEDALAYLNHDEKELIRLEDYMLIHAERGDVIKDTGGARKLRYEHARRGKGKRSGLRIIYFWLPNRLIVVCVDIYSKDDKENLSTSDLESLRRMSRRLRAEGKEETP